MQYYEYNQCAVTKIRTWDLVITNDVLYHLSYNGMMALLHSNRKNLVVTDKI